MLNSLQSVENSLLECVVQSIINIRAQIWIPSLWIFHLDFGFFSSIFNDQFYWHLSHEFINFIEYTLARWEFRNGFLQQSCFDRNKITYFWASKKVACWCVAYWCVASIDNVHNNVSVRWWKTRLVGPWKCKRMTELTEG